MLLPSGVLCIGVLWNPGLWRKFATVRLQDPSRQNTDSYQLMQMGGLQNLSGWRWIFIIEGLITCLLGIGGYWLLVDFPDSKRASWNFLNEKERSFIVARVQADRGDAQVFFFHPERQWTTLIIAIRRQLPSA